MEKAFLVTIISERTSYVEEQLAIKGKTLYNAVFNKLLSTGGEFLFWNHEILGEDTLLEEKAVTILTQLEGTDCCEYTITVSDITDLNNIYIIYPSEKRPGNFNPLIIGKMFYINCWIPAYDNLDDRPKFDSLIKAEQEVEELRIQSPNNIYRIEGE